MPRGRPLDFRIFVGSVRGDGCEVDKITGVAAAVAVPAITSIVGCVAGTC